MVMSCPRPALATPPWLSLFVLLFLLPLLPAAAQSPTSIQGTITLHGCTASANQFNLQAEPTATADPTQRTNPRSGGGATRARVGAASLDGRQFSFEIPDLALQDFLLNFRFLGQSCSQLFWSGLGDGRALPGQPLEIHGYAARTRVEILGLALPPNPCAPRDASCVSTPAAALRTKAEWVGADLLDYSDPVQGVRRLRVQTDLTNITSVVLQIAADPFPVGGRTAKELYCESDSKMLRAISFPVRAGRGWTELPPIDFHQLLMPTRRIGDGDTGGPGIASTDAGPPLDPIDANVFKMLEAGAPLYMRVIPVADGVRRCDDAVDGVPGWIKAAKKLPTVPAGPPPEGQDLRIRSATYQAPRSYPWPIPGVHQYCLRATENHPIPNLSGAALIVADPYAFSFVNAKPRPAYWTPGGMVYANEVLCFYKSSGGGSSWWDVASGLVTGVIDNLGSLVNSASALWESIKEAVVNIAASVISAVGVPCDDVCKGLLTTGLNVALASAGIPPSIPNTDQLKADAKAWVAAQIADQSGVPGSEYLAAKAVDYAEASLSEYFKKGGGSGTASWLTSDIGLDPGVLTLNLERVQPLLPDQNTKYYQFYPPTLLMLHKSEFFAFQPVPLPKRFWTQGFPTPGLPDTLKVPLVLKPNLDKVPANWQATWQAATTGNSYLLTMWNKQHWTALLTSNSCNYFMMDWINPEFVNPKKIKYLGTLGANVLTNTDYGPGPLADPATYVFCK